MAEKVKKSTTKKEDVKEHIARVRALNLPISTKQSIEICNYLRYRKLKQAKELLKKVIDKKLAVPFKRYNRDVGHKRGKIAAGRFPNKASSQILKLLDALEANAEFKGLNADKIKITKIVANNGTKIWHHGRKRRRRMKRTHIEVVVEEQK